MKYFFILFSLFLLSSCSVDSDGVIIQVENKEYKLEEVLEAAYFSGQQDAINGDVRIKFDYEKNKWEWVRSPWNNKKTPTWHPTKKGKFTEQF